MRIINLFFESRLLRLMLGVLLSTGGTQLAMAQSAGEVKYLRVGSLHNFYSEQGAEPEFSTSTYCNDGLWWPAEYGDQLSSQSSRSFWIGTRNYYDPLLEKDFLYKVVGNGPRRSPDAASQVFEYEHKLVGRFPHPTVIVDGANATENDLYDVLDEIDENIIADRIVVTTVNTSIGVTMTRKCMAFSQQNHDNYFIYDYIFKNTGIVDAEGTVITKSLEEVVFQFQYRNSPGGGEPVPGYNEGWGIWNSTWGRNCVNHVIGPSPDAPGWEFTAAYSWYGPHSLRTNVSDDWGCPNEQEDGILGGVQYCGVVVLHADQSAQDKTNDPYQPTTTHFIGSDGLYNRDFSQYDEELMRQKYEVMTMGHAEQTHAEQVFPDGWRGDNGVGRFADLYGTDEGGNSQALGFGPYTLEPGDSIHVVLAEVVAGISRQKNREVGGNWIAWYKGEGNPTLIMPGTAETTDYDAYKRAWVQTGEDSILQTFRRAVNNYSNNLDFPQPPPPPNVFEITSGGDRIRLSWTDNALSHPNFDGYVVYRSEGSVATPETIYEKIFECDYSDVVHTFDDTTARRGFNYYYHIQSKDDGSTNDVHPGVPLYSSKFYTLTNEPAFLRRPAGEELSEIRVVPNPYYIKAREFQFGEKTTFDRIAFFGLPPVCTIKIYTERGDLIWEKYHDDGSGDELWNSLTSSGQIVVSGLYIAYFETPEGESLIRKFIIFR